LPFTAAYFFSVVLAILIVIAGSLIYTYRRRLRYIDAYSWPPGLVAKLRRHYPNLSPEQIDRIGLGLKQFFRAYHRGAYRNVAMPSQAVDVLWHEFILYTKAYDDFCRRAFGRFLHHTPAAVLKPGQNKTNEGLRRVWWHASKEERIDPRSPAGLPLLFALDAELKIPNGYRYVPDCGTVRTISFEVGYGQQTQCGNHFASTSFDGGTDGLGDGDGGGGDSDGGGGCGGD
jgi:hypothetical protein